MSQTTQCLAKNENLARANQESHFEALSNEKQEILVNWCKANFNAVKTINTQITSYDIKQTFSSLEDGSYVTNGQIKGAMVKAGFEMKTAKDGINSRFNVSKTSPYFKD